MASPAARENRASAGALETAGVLSAYAVVLILVPSRFTIGSYAISAGMIVALVAGLVWFAGMVGGSTTSLLSEPAGRGTLAFLVTMFVAYTVTMTQPNPVSAVGSADRRMAATMCFAFAGFLALDGLRSRRALRRVVTAIVYAATVMATIGILQYLTPINLAPSLRPPGFAAGGRIGFVFERGGFTRIAGTTRHPIEFGITCAMVLPLALHLSANAVGRRSRIAAKVCVLVLAIALPMSLSRAAVLGVIAGVAIVFTGWSGRRQINMLGIVGVGLWLGTLLLADLGNAISELFTGDLAANSDAAREEAAGTAFELFTESPIVGQGLGALQGIIVDNQYSLTLAEAGVVGLVGAGLLVFGGIGSARAARRVSDDVALRDLGRAFIAVLITAMVASTGLATLVFPTVAGLIILVVGLCGALHRVVLDERPVTADADEHARELVAP